MAARRPPKEIKMNQEMLAMVDSISREKDMDKETVFRAIEESMAFAAKKRLDKELGEETLVSAEIDRRTGEAHLTRVWRVREDNIIDIPGQEVARIDMEPEQKGLTEVSEPLSVEFGRSSAQLAKQSILQRLRDLEQQAALADLKTEGDTILFGTVRGFQKGAALLDVGRLDAQMPKSEQLLSDKLKIGQRVRCSIHKVERVGNRDVVTVSRASPEFLQALIEREVPEVEEGLVEIVRVARAPGVRSKVVVRLTEAGRERNLEESRAGMGRGQRGGHSIDPARAVIGMRGLHAKAISEELGGEHIDVLTHNPDLAEALKEALSPAQIVKIAIDEDAHMAEVAVEEESLGLAIGSRGANVRLIGEALGWAVQLMTAEEFENKDQERARRAVDHLMQELDVDEEVAIILFENGVSDVDTVAYAPLAELEAIEEFDADIVQALRDRARPIADARRARQAQMSGAAHASLARVETISEREIEQLIAAEIYSADDLADLATDELLEKVEWPQKRAQDLIMKARKLWESDEASNGAAA
jgi:transcription termination/antitermination protein NusA